jgi:hypothetical protein
MSYSNINEVFNNNNLKKDNTIKWDDFSDDEYSTHKNYSLMDIGTLMDADDMNTKYHTPINSLKMKKNEEKEEDKDCKISHRDCIKKYFNISSHPLNLDVALKHINLCSICKNEIERINNTKYKYKQECNYETNKHNLINKIDDITNKVNTLTNGYGPYQNHNYEYINYKINDAVRTSVNDAVRTSVNDTVRTYVNDAVRTYVNDAVRTYVNDAVRTSVNDAVRTSVNDAVRTSVNDVVRTSVNDVVRTSVNDVVRTSVNDVVRTSVNDVVRTSVNDVVNKKKEHFGTINNGNNTFITVSIIIIIILLFIDIYLRLKNN